MFRLSQVPSDCFAEVISISSPADGGRSETDASPNTCEPGRRLPRRPSAEALVARADGNHQGNEAGEPDAFLRHIVLAWVQRLCSQNRYSAHTPRVGANRLKTNARPKVQTTAFSI